MDRIQVCVVVRPCVQAIDYADGHVPGVYVIEMNDMVPTDSLANAAKDAFNTIVPIRNPEHFTITVEDMLGNPLQENFLWEQTSETYDAKLIEKVDDGLTPCPGPALENSPDCMKVRAMADVLEKRGFLQRA